jgi:hypothetical protein
MSRSSAINDLRRTIDCLPLPTRRAMLDGVRGEQIIVGAYTDGSGGVCPMLAAHRRGGRTSFLQFARTWDRFTKAPARGSRPASGRELRILERQLEASIEASEEALTGIVLADAIAEHQRLVAQRPTPVAAPEPAKAPRRSRPIVRMPSWMRPIGSIEEYERVLGEVDRQKVRLGLVDDTARRPPAEPASGDRPRTHVVR